MQFSVPLNSLLSSLPLSFWPKVFTPSLQLVLRDNGSEEYKVDWGIVPHWMEELMKKMCSYLPTVNRYMSCYIQESWPPSLSVEVGKVFYHFLFYRNMTGRQRVPEKMKSFHRRETFVSVYERRFPLWNDFPAPQNPSKWWEITVGMRLVLHGAEGFSENNLEKCIREGSKIYIQSFQKIPFSRLISTFVVYLERVAPSTHCSSEPKHLQSIFCLLLCTEVATDLWNTKLGSFVFVFLLLSHSAIFYPVGFVLLKTLSFIHFTELHHPRGPLCVWLLPSILQFLLLSQSEEIYP